MDSQTKQNSESKNAEIIFLGGCKEHTSIYNGDEA